MSRSLAACFVGTFTLRLATGLTGALLGFYLAHLADLGGSHIDALVVGFMSAGFYLSELILATPFGVVSDRLGHHRVMQAGPVFGFAAAVVTGLSRFLAAAASPLLVPVLTLTRSLEGTSTAASVPSILGYIAAATAGDEGLRGRSAALFETATLGGLGAGFVVAPKLFEWAGTTAFFLNAAIYVVSLLIFRIGVSDPRADLVGARPVDGGWRRYGHLLGNAEVLLLAPTWIAVNAAIGLWFSQSVYQFARRNDHFPNQLLHRGFDTTQITLAAVIIMAVFAAGLFYWGGRFRNLRRSTIILYGVLGGAAVVASCLIINHSQDLPLVLPVGFGAVAAVGLFVLAGATPAALGLLADISERFPDDRGAIMGLYSVFLAIGQIVGSLVGGVAATMRGIDGLLVTTLVMLAIALVPLFRLRSLEHLLGHAHA